MHIHRLHHIKTYISIWLAMIILLLSVSLCGCAVATEGHTGTESETQASTPVGSSDSGKRVALTFDDGPHNVRTPQIVDELDKYGYHATFFVVGNRVDGTAYNGGDAMVYAAEHGNEIGIHGYTHEAYYDTCDDTTYREELSLTEAAIKARLKGVGGVRLMRPVGGRISQDRAKTCPYGIAMWSVDSEDWKHKYKPGDGEAEWTAKVDTIVENVMSQVQEGDIILMHDIYESTYDAVVILLERLHAEGYEVVTMSELLGGKPVAGRTYYVAPDKG